MRYAWLSPGPPSTELALISFRSTTVRVCPPGEPEHVAPIR